MWECPLSKNFLLIMSKVSDVLRQYNKLEATNWFSKFHPMCLVSSSFHVCYRVNTDLSLAYKTIGCILCKICPCMFFLHEQASWISSYSFPYSSPSFFLIESIAILLFFTHSKTILCVFSLLQDALEMFHLLMGIY